MNRILSVLLVSFFFTVSVFAQQNDSGIDKRFNFFKPATYYGVTVPGEEEEGVVPSSISNNEYYLKSLQLNKLALETYEYGDYDTSAGFAQEAVRFAELSDEYVSVQLIAEAKRLLEWADKNNIAAKFPNNYEEGKTQYENAVDAHANENWNESIDAAIKSIEIFAAFESGGRPPATTTASNPTTPAATGLPRQYTVRTWRVERDCLWTIAGYPWVYNDPWKWKLLYDANKDIMPEPANPDLIVPGQVLTIPSISGETRQGMWTVR
jgi:nucleoid-associated protein YgaU